jgi:heavy metal translocating P-type ATPase
MAERRDVPAISSKGERRAQTLSLLLVLISSTAIAAHLALRFGWQQPPFSENLPLHVALIAGGVPLVLGLTAKLVRRDFSSDLLAGISIVTAVILGEYLAGTIVVLMLSGGQALEAYASRRASSALLALSRRMPATAQRLEAGELRTVQLQDVAIGDFLVISPHQTCPVDGVVIAGQGQMDESYLTGEPYQLSKAVGSTVISGAVNGETALTIRAEAAAIDSRYAKIIGVMRESEQRRPRMRRLGDQLGAFYTPLAVAIALVAWYLSGDAVRFLAVLVVATPCPLLIGIPVAIVGSISLAARRGIIIRDPMVLERIDSCRTAIFDKTGTLTYGTPELTEVLAADDTATNEVLAMVASLEQYSRHPLASPIMAAGRLAGLQFSPASEVSERPGQGLRGIISGRSVEVTSRKKLIARDPNAASQLPALTSGLECVVLRDDRYLATLRFHDEPRSDSSAFIDHLAPRHNFTKVMLVSGDRASEVNYLAAKVGISEVYSDQSPEQKLAIVRKEMQHAPTVFMGDGINDAPALAAATVGIAFGQGSDVTAEAAGAVILDSSLQRVDELLHIGRRMRSIALQSAVGGMALSTVAMLVAAAGYLPPVAGAVTQEIIDVLVVMNALRASTSPGVLTDF